MSDPSDVWQNSAPANDGYSREQRDGSPRRDDRDRSPPPPRRDRSRSPGARNGGDGERREERRERRGDGPRGGGGGGGPDEGPEVKNTGNNLHVSGLPKSINDRGLEELFSKCGKITKVQVMADPHTGESRGFGFVMFETNEEAENAITTMNGTSHDGRSITVVHAKRSRARTPTPGRYHGVKYDRPGGDFGGRGGYGGGGGGGYGGGRGGYEDRPYHPRSYDSRYSDRGPRYDDRRDYDRRDDRGGGGRYGGGDRYEDRRGGGGGYDDYRRGPPPPDRYEDRRDDRGPRYDERPRY